MGYTSKNPNADVPEGKVPGGSGQEGDDDYELAIPSNSDDAVTYRVVLPKKKLDQHTPDDVPAEPEED
ncbi:MAG TPA: hypothetical protein VFP10_12990 [Candidatus Eisenbacteria bacterium]|nr:hypothetical protein [Candidatus Eisenbacteria bacterium]